jgi:hypothetical protein
MAKSLIGKLIVLCVMSPRLFGLGCGGQRIHVGANTAATLPPRTSKAMPPTMPLTVDMLHHRAATLFLVLMHNDGRLLMMMRHMMLAFVHRVAATSPLHTTAFGPLFTFGLRDNRGFGSIVVLLTLMLLRDISPASAVVVLHVSRLFVMMGNMMLPVM